MNEPVQCAARLTQYHRVAFDHSYSHSHFHSDALCRRYQVPEICDRMVDESKGIFRYYHMLIGSSLK